MISIFSSLVAFTLYSGTRAISTRPAFMAFSFPIIGRLQSVDILAYGKFSCTPQQGQIEQTKKGTVISSVKPNFL